MKLTSTQNASIGALPTVETATGKKADVGVTSAFSQGVR